MVDDKDFIKFAREQAEKNKQENPERYDMASMLSDRAEKDLSSFHEMIYKLDIVNHELAIKMLQATFVASIMSVAKDFDESYRMLEDMKSMVSSQESMFNKNG